MIPMTLAEAARAARGRILAGSPGLRLSGVSTDTRTIARGDLFVPLSAARDGHAFIGEAFRRGAAATLCRRDRADLARGRPAIAVDDPAEALLDLARLARSRLRARVVAVTGSCGKTTVKEMLAAILAARGETAASPKSFNNAIGVPLTILSAAPATRFLVVEVGTSAPGEVDLLASVARPHVSVLTLAASAHLAGLGTVAGVVREKSAIWRRLERGGTAVFNADQASRAEVRRVWKGKAVSFGLDAERAGDLRAEQTVLDAGGSRFRVGAVRFRLPLPGLHNVANALAALAAARALGVPLAAAAGPLARLAASPGRLCVRRAGGVEVWDDSYNANPASTEAALAAFAAPAGRDGGRSIAVLGDMRELGRASRALHRRVGRAAARSGLDRLLAVGPSMRHAAAAARAAGLPASRVEMLPDAASAARALARLVRPGDRVLVKGSREMRMERAIEALLAAEGAR